MPLLFEAKELDGARVGLTGETYEDVRFMLPALDEREFPLLSGIDRYGTTVFNGLQCQRIANELARLRETEITNDQARLIDAIEAVTVQVTEKPHRLLWVIGD
jgi:hypothetical protein